LGGHDRTNGYIPGMDSSKDDLVITCQDITVQLPSTGSISIDPEDVLVPTTSCLGIDLSLDITEFDCSDVGDHTVTLTADIGGSVQTCTAIVTVIEIDSDNDGVLDCSDACPTDPNKW